jgi:uncharacterized protein YaiE (UPF0345 family)
VGPLGALHGRRSAGITPALAAGIGTSGGRGSWYFAHMKFENVTAVAKANVYFEGKVVSHSLLFADGTRKTLGLIYPGEYHFGTDAPERMDIVAGSCRVRLDGSAEWRDHDAGSFFKVPGKSGFDIAVTRGITEYVCSFE